MNNSKSSEGTRSGAPGLRRSPFAEHVVQAMLYARNPRTYMKVAATIGVLAAGAAALSVGSERDGLLPNDDPGMAQRQAALREVGALDGPVEIDAGSNMHTTNEWDEPNDQGGGPDNLLPHTLNANIIVREPLEVPDQGAGWDAVVLPGHNTVKASDTVWFNVEQLVQQGMAHYLPQSADHPTFGVYRVEPNGSVDQVKPNGTLVPDPGAGLSHYASPK